MTENRKKKQYGFRLTKRTIERLKILEKQFQCTDRTQTLTVCVNFLWFARFGQWHFVKNDEKKGEGFRILRLYANSPVGIRGDTRERGV